MSAPVMAKLTCRHTVEVHGGRNVGDKVPCYVCPETKTGAATRTVKQLHEPAPVEAPAKPAGKRAKRAVDDPAKLAEGAAVFRRALARKKQGGPPVRCPGVGQEGLDGPGTRRCPVCTQDLAPVRRDGSLGSHKLLRPRGGDLPDA